MRRIAAEKENPGGDVFWSGGFGTLGNYTDYFERYASPELANIAAEFRGPENLWTGTNVHPIAVMINTSRLGGRAAPKTWSDLLGSQWRGQVAITDPANSSLSYIQIYGVLQLLGLDGLKQLARNAVIVGTTGQVHAGVGNGEFPVGLTSESSAYEYIAGGQSNIAIVYPSDGTFLSPEGMVIIKNAKNKPAALALYNAFLSKEVQEELLRKVFRRPSRPDVKVSEIVKLPELSSIKVFPLDQQKAAEQITSVIKVWKEAVAAAKG